MLRTALLLLLVGALACSTARRRGKGNDGDASDGADTAVDTAVDTTDATDASDTVDTVDGIDGSDASDGVTVDTSDTADAADGRDGTDGTDAGDAADGANAADGTDGTDGTNAADGTDGTDGIPTVVTARDLQLSAGSLNCDPTVNVVVSPAVILDDVVVTGGAFVIEGDTGPTLRGFYVQDANGGPSSGIQVVAPEADVPTLAPGHRLRIEGSHREFYCRTTLSAVAITPLGALGAPAPSPVSAAQLVSGPEAFEGMLVRVEGVTVQSLDNFDAVVTGGLRVSGGQYEPGWFPKVGDSYVSLTGLVDFAFGAYRLQVRSLDDVVPDTSVAPTTMTIAEIQADSSSTTCTTGSANPPPAFSNVAVTGLVYSPVESVTASLHGVYLASPNTTDRAGLLVVWNKTLGFSPLPGARVRAVGDVKEYFCMTELTATALEVLDANGAVPTPSKLSLADPEQQEGAFVFHADITVESTEALETYNEIEVTGGFVIDGGNFGVPLAGFTVGDSLEGVQGALGFAFGKYRIYPFEPSDISQ